MDNKTLDTYTTPWHLVALLFGNYLSRNRSNLKSRIAELRKEGICIPDLEEMAELGWIRKMEIEASQEHFERAMVSELRAMEMELIAV